MGGSGLRGVIWTSTGISISTRKDIGSGVLHLCFRPVAVPELPIPWIYQRLFAFLVRELLVRFLILVRGRLIEVHQLFDLFLDLIEGVCS